MAGFRSGRGRGSRGAQQQGQYPSQPPQQAPGRGPGPGPGPAPGQGWPQPPQGPGGPGAYGHGQGGRPPYGPTGGHQGGYGNQGAPGEPEYFGAPGPDPYANNPGHTQSFSVPDPYGPDQGPGPDGYYADGGVYAAGNAPAPPAGPRLHWKDLLRGIVTRPSDTFWQMRDYPVWGPALIVTFLYGLLAVFGLDQAREDVINTTISSAIPYVITTGIAVVIAGLILGTVTHTLARQFGGDGAWAPTVGLAMLIMSLTDAPRLLFAMFMGGTAPLVQIVGWLTWIAAGYLFTSMVSRSHDLPWPKALGASAIQLLALLALIKLGTL
ncbi:Yip1 family protein [Streptomyces sp. NPDC048172]|uniref:Yip1 family protein n=1 Tax=Streptomyces sp. NPDC048172 TaxID=3365505 RepID=UPI00372341CD